MYAIVKYEPKRESDVNAFLLGMYLLYASRPGKRQPELDGSYFIGDVGETRLQDQRLRRETPYSICGGLRSQAEGTPDPARV